MVRYDWRLCYCCNLALGMPDAYGLCRDCWSGWPQ